mmetsp:Transcript_24207/g.76135  ORF Transcript_24207/g.76135 Transcript_24207/m.76135 type:complete len:543 (-) Transcript_24207:188-1816(-)
MKEKELRPSAPDEEDQVHITPGMTKYQKFFAFLGPGILIATVYVDPGQIVVDMESGSVFKYKMLWALLLANGMGLLFQHLCSRLAVVTGRNLAQENRLEYPTHVRVFLWFSVEVASIAADLGYVMGTATAIEILFGVPLHWGVLVTGLDTFLALGLQQFGIRKVEALVGALFGLVVACYMVELSFVKPDLGGVLDGMIPRLWHSNERFGVGVWLELLCANLGAAVCPPNFFLQSALVRTRKIERTAAGVREAFEYNLYETGICLGLATAINVAMLLLAAGEMFPERVKSLSQGADLLNNTLGGLARCWPNPKLSTLSPKPQALKTRSPRFHIPLQVCLRRGDAVRRAVVLAHGRPLDPVHHGGIFPALRAGMDHPPLHPDCGYRARLPGGVLVRAGGGGRHDRAGPGGCVLRGPVLRNPPQQVLVLEDQDGPLQALAPPGGGVLDIRGGRHGSQSRVHVPRAHGLGRGPDGSSDRAHRHARRRLPGAQEAHCGDGGALEPGGARGARRQVGGCARPCVPGLSKIPRATKPCAGVRVRGRSQV